MVGSSCNKISKNMALLMVALEKNISPFSKNPKSHEKHKYYEEPTKEKEELKLEKRNSSNQSSHNLFKK